MPDLEIYQEGTPDMSNFAGTPQIDNKLMAKIKAYQKMFAQGKGNANIVSFTIQFSVSNTDTAEAQFYINPSLLANVGNEGVLATGATFKSIAGVNKLTLNSFSGHLATFLNWVRHKPTVCDQILITADKAAGIADGSITTYSVSPNLATGYTSSEPIPFSNYNDSKAFTDVKAEIKDKLFFLDDETANVVTIPAGTKLTFSLRLFAYNSAEYAMFYHQRFGA